MNEQQLKEHVRHLSKTWDIPQESKDYLVKLKSNYNFEPNVIYDIGSCVLHWTRCAKTVWPNSEIYLFEAMRDVEFLYQEEGFQNYAIGVFGDCDNKEVTFYESVISPGGNSYYREFGWARDVHYTLESGKRCKIKTIDTTVNEKGFKLPDLIKIDVQGCEVDILKGMQYTLSTCKHLIVELQHLQYNEGAPLAEESIPFIESLGFTLETPLFSNNGPDGDYHFIKANI